MSFKNALISLLVLGLSGLSVAQTVPSETALVKEEEPAKERGFYKHPELYGAPEEKSILWVREPNAMKQWKETRAKAAAATEGESPAKP